MTQCLKIVYEFIICELNYYFKKKRKVVYISLLTLPRLINIKNFINIKTICKIEYLFNNQLK